MPPGDEYVIRHLLIPALNLSEISDTQTWKTCAETWDISVTKHCFWSGAGLAEDAALLAKLNRI